MNYIVLNMHLQSITNNSFNLPTKKCCLFITVKSLLTHVYLTTDLPFINDGYQTVFMEL